VIVKTLQLLPLVDSLEVKPEKEPISLTAKQWKVVVLFGLINTCLLTLLTPENIFLETKCLLLVSLQSKTELTSSPSSEIADICSILRIMQSFLTNLSFLFCLFFKRFRLILYDQKQYHYFLFFFFLTSKKVSFVSGSETKILFWLSRNARISGKFWTCLYHLKRLLYWTFC